MDAAGHQTRACQRLASPLRERTSSWQVVQGTGRVKKSSTTQTATSTFANAAGTPVGPILTRMKP